MVTRSRATAGPAVSLGQTGSPARKLTGRRRVAVGAVVTLVLALGGYLFSYVANQVSDSPATAKVGQCLNGTGETSKVVACSDPSAVYQVVKVFNNETDMSVCQGIQGATASYSQRDSSTAVVLCLASNG
jgi:hypothetical protein